MDFRLSALPMFVCKCDGMTSTRTMAKNYALSRNPESFEESYQHFKRFMLKKIRDKCKISIFQPFPNDCVFCSEHLSEKDLLQWLDTHQSLVRQLLERSIMLLARENADILIEHFKRAGEMGRPKK